MQMFTGQFFCFLGFFLADHGPSESWNTRLKCHAFNFCHISHWVSLPLCLAKERSKMRVGDYSAENGKTRQPRLCFVCSKEQKPRV